MSAMLGIRTADAVHLMTDAAAVNRKDGTLVARKEKIYVGRGGVTFAGMGSWSTPLRFAHLADVLAMDEVTDAARALWAEARAPLQPGSLAIPTIVLFAGWSAKRARLEMHGIKEVDGKLAVYGDHACHVAGPSADNGVEIATPFYTRFNKAPEGFTVHDGVEFMQLQRTRCLKQFETHKGPAVGGFVSLVTVTRERITGAIVRRWPDRIGYVLNAGAPADAQWEDERVLIQPWPGGPRPSAARILHLVRYPHLWREFDEDHGKGWADWYLQSFGYLKGWHGGPVAADTAEAA